MHRHCTLVFRCRRFRGKGKLIIHESVSEKGGRSTTYEARLGWATLMFKVIEVKAAQGGGRFEIILPNARFMRDPLKHEGSKPLPMRILGQDPSKALPAPAQNLPYTADEASAKAKGSAKRDQTEPSGIVAKAIAAARGVSEVHRSPCSGGTATLILNGHLKTSQCESCPTREFCAAFHRD